MPRRRGLRATAATTRYESVGIKAFLQGVSFTADSTEIAEASAFSALSVVKERCPQHAASSYRT